MQGHRAVGGGRLGSRAVGAVGRLDRPTIERAVGRSVGRPDCWTIGRSGGRPAQSTRRPRLEQSTAFRAMPSLVSAPEFRRVGRSVSGGVGVLNWSCAEVLPIVYIRLKPRHWDGILFEVRGVSFKGAHHHALATQYLRNSQCGVQEAHVLDDHKGASALPGRTWGDARFVLGSCRTWQVLADGSSRGVARGTRSRGVAGGAPEVRSSETSPDHMRPGCGCGRRQVLPAPLVARMPTLQVTRPKAGPTRD